MNPELFDVIVRAREAGVFEAALADSRRRTLRSESSELFFPEVERLVGAVDADFLAELTWAAYNGKRKDEDEPTGDLMRNLKSRARDWLALRRWSAG